MGSAPSKPNIFRPKFDQQFMLFLAFHSGRHFLTFWRNLMPKLWILTPLAPSLAQNGAQNQPRCAKSTPKKHKPVPPGAVLTAPCIQRALSDRSWAPLWSILDDFSKKFNGFGDHFGYMFDALQATTFQKLLATKFCKKAAKNRQELPRIVK